MKRKFVSVLLTLVLVLSFSLVTAAPAAAAEAEYTLITGGVGVAEWSADESYTGSYSLKLFAPAATGDYGKVVMPLAMEFEELLDFSVWVEGGTAAQALPLHDIKAEMDATSVILTGGNNHVASDVELNGKILVLASQPGQSETLSTTLMSDGIAGWEKYGTHSGADIDVGTGAYWSIFVYSAEYAFEAVYDYFTWDAIHTLLDGNAAVTEVRVELRYPQDPADVASTVYVDDIVINTVTYAMEQPAAVWVAKTGDDANPGTEASPFLTIQHAIDILAGDCIVNVAAGTYAENVVADKALTLQGAEGATIAPATGCGVEIQASDITVDSFVINTSGLDAHGIYISVGATGLTLTGDNITIGGVSTAIYADAGAGILEDGMSSGWTISGNTLDAANGVNLELYDVDTVLVDDNIFKITNSNSSLVYSSEYFDVGSVIISNNDFQGNGDIAGVTATIWIESTFQLWDGSTAVDGVTITGNTFDNWVNRAIEIGEAADPTGATFGLVSNVVVNSNDFLDTGTALANYTGNAIDAQNNWWGDTRGPNEGAASETAGAGVIDSAPWLISLSGDPFDTSYTDYEYIYDGWTLNSPSRAWAAWEALSSDLVLTYDTSLSEPAFAEPQSSSLSPLSAIYIKTTGGGLLGSNYPATDLGMYTSDLASGWNLISVPETDADIGALLSHLRYGENDGTALATLVSQGNYNLEEDGNPGESFYLSAIGNLGWMSLWDETLYPSDGYWAYMNIAKEFGVIVVDEPQ